MNTFRFTPNPFTDMLPFMADAPLRRDELAQTSFRPTVIVGIGGTGYAVVRRLNTLLGRYFQGEELEIFQPIVFDTAPEDVPEGEEPLGAGQFVSFPSFDSAELFEHLDENPYIADWWPGGTQRPYRAVFAGTGARRVRAVGRLVLHNYMGSVVLPRLREKIKRARDVNAQHGIGASNLKFYIVCSLAGGTGSGMLLDLCYVTRMLGLDKHTTPYLTGMLVLDEPFIDKAETEHEAAEFSANCAAALFELNHFMTARRFSERYNAMTSTATLPGGFRPLDVAYLLNLTNARGQALPNFEALADMIAAEMMVEIASPMQGPAGNLLDNVRAVERAVAGQPAAFSSFALSSQTYPLHGIASYCGLAGLAPFSEQVLLAPRRPVSEVPGDVLAFAQAAGVEEEQADQVIERLSLDRKGQALATPLLGHTQVDSLPEGQLLGVLQQLEESALGELALLREAVAANAPAVVRQFEAALHAAMEAVVRDPQRGPVYAAWVLEGLQARLGAGRDLMVSEQASYQAEAETQTAAWNSARAALTEALRLPRWQPWRRARVNSARTGYVAAFNAYLAAQHELERRTQAIQVYKGLIDAASRLTHRANDWVNGWRQLARHAAERAEAEATQERATSTAYSLIRSIAGPEDLQPTFARHWPALAEPEQRDHLASRFWQFVAARLPAWRLADGKIGPHDEANPAVQVYYFLADWYGRELRGKSLLDRLAELHGDDWPQEVALAYAQTEPFWNYNLSRYSDRIRGNLTNDPRMVGYGADDPEVWGDAVSKAVGVSLKPVNNKNPHEMVFLRTSHGLPLFALRGIATLREKYDYLKRLWDEGEEGAIPLHISSRWEGELRDYEPIKSAPPSPAPAEAAAGGNGRQRQPETPGEAS